MKENPVSGDPVVWLIIFGANPYSPLGGFPGTRVLSYCRVEEPYFDLFLFIFSIDIYYLPQPKFLS